MARVAGCYAVGHAPNLVGAWEDAGPDVCRGVKEACAELGRRMRALGVTTVITVANDHFNNFFLNNLPAYCVGLADSWLMPEAAMGVPAAKVPGNPRLAWHIVEHLFHKETFEPAVSHGLRPDHGTFVPLRETLPALDLPLVPIFQNTVQPPLPTFQRAAQFGSALRRAVESYAGDERVAIIGTGGMSHFIGVPCQGDINEAFDRKIVGLLEAGDLDGVIGIPDKEYALAGGNGAAEFRNWVVSMAAAQSGGAEVLFYAPVPAWLIGMGVVDFRAAA